MPRLLTLWCLSGYWNLKRWPRLVIPKMFIFRESPLSKPSCYFTSLMAIYSYDKLIIACGSTSSTHGIQGLKHCFQLKTISDAQAIRRRILGKTFAIDAFIIHLWLFRQFRNGQSSYHNPWRTQAFVVIRCLRRWPHGRWDSSCTSISIKICPYTIKMDFIHTGNIRFLSRRYRKLRIFFSHSIFICAWLVLYSTPRYAAKKSRFM